MSSLAGRLDAQYYLGEDSVILVRKISDGYYQVLSSGWETNEHLFFQQVKTNPLHTRPTYYAHPEGYTAEELIGLYRLGSRCYYLVTQSSEGNPQRQSAVIRRVFLRLAAKHAVKLPSNRISIDQTCTDGYLLEGRVTLQR
jgi:hypothetical protein